MIALCLNDQIFDKIDLIQDNITKSGLNLNGKDQISVCRQIQRHTLLNAVRCTNESDSVRETGPEGSV